MRLRAVGAGVIHPPPGEAVVVLRGAEARALRELARELGLGEAETVARALTLAGTMRALLWTAQVAGRTSYGGTE